ncbi:hypothetical protein, partial [Lacrimispora sp.]|uniref:hypothetical protein n=1 Tax=Lacrimispora sp. TaxID=2719234 RepID=UPI0032163150
QSRTDLNRDPPGCLYYFIAGGICGTAGYSSLTTVVTEIVPEYLIFIHVMYNCAPFSLFFLL